MSNDTLTSIAEIAAADRLMPRKCAGCTQSDLDQCAPCYARLYPHAEVQAMKLKKQLDDREQRYKAIEEFIAQWVTETGYGVDVKWTLLNLTLDPPLNRWVLTASLNSLIRQKRIRRTIVPRGENKGVYYWPAESTPEGGS